MKKFRFKKGMTRKLGTVPYKVNQCVLNFRNNNVFRAGLKDERDVVYLIESGRMFHNIASLFESMSSRGTSQSMLSMEWAGRVK